MYKKVIFNICMIFSFCCCAQNQKFESFTPAEFEKLLKDDSSIQLVDVRRPEEYSAGHINNAVLIYVQEDNFISKADSMLDKSKPVAVYCRSGKRSKDASKKLAGKGYKVYELNDGYLGWVEYRKTIDNVP